MAELEFHRVTLNVRNKLRRHTDLQRLASLNIPGPVRRTAQWFRPQSETTLDKGITIVDFYRHLSTIVFRNPRSVPASVKPDITEQMGVSQSSSGRPLTTQIAKELPLGTSPCALVKAIDRPERIIVVPFSLLDEAVTSAATGEKALAEKFAAAREQEYPPALCRAIGEAMTPEIFFAAVPHVLPPQPS